MTSSHDMRAWYVPVEIVLLRRWIVAAFLVNVLLLTVDYLRADSQLLMLGIFSCVLFASLRASLPEVNNQLRRNVSLVLSAALLGIAVYRFMVSDPTFFNIWIHCWTLIPSGLSLLWLSGVPVTVWTSRKLSDSAIEYGLMRNVSVSKRYHSISPRTSRCCTSSPSRLFR